MTTVSTGCCGSGVCGCGLPDMSGVKLADLLSKTPPGLARSVARLVRGLDDPNGVISAFSSFVE